ncbi:zinc finger CCCH-type with G patch domain-containing protein [Ischnura elegans]|uniref:zinc finger CCCH-type with G patch domain-containing protein n=1 Tax=Ischnura elegans TaxID=197161 RepID=UPI001ED88B0A|nr:zinc finger CCCH-type with G patch domain-containing protein [Ischnura elegans]
MDSQSEETLLSSIAEYEIQLDQVNKAISITPPEQRESLETLQADIQEVIKLTKENLLSLKKQQLLGVLSSIEEESAVEDDPFKAEYELFKAEVGSTLADNEEKRNTDAEDNSYDAPDITDELKSLEGMRCQVPHSHEWGETSYHNAIVSQVEPYEEGVSSVHQIQVRVIFVNPTHQEMLPCPYFLEGNCKFSDDKCRYSHGEVVKLSSLREFKEPDFSQIAVGSRVLAKRSDGLWHRARVTNSPTDNSYASRDSQVSGDGGWVVKFESSGKITETNLADLLPLEDLDLTSSSSDDSEEDEEEVYINEDLVQRSLLTTPQEGALGAWEKHTKGIGSLLMSKMGYVVGTGLGKRGEGRLEPVPAVVLPTGKSLDHCMAMKEQGWETDPTKAGGAGMKKVKKKWRKGKGGGRRKGLKNKDGLQATPDTNVFDFINSHIAHRKGDKKPSVNKSEPPLSARLSIESCHKLRVTGLQLEEDIKRAERDLIKLKDSLQRHGFRTAIWPDTSPATSTSRTGNPQVARLQKAVAAKEAELAKLKEAEVGVAMEQGRRTAHKKLTIF